MSVSANFPHGQRIAHVPIGTKAGFTATIATTATLIRAGNSRRSSLVMAIASGGPVYLGRDNTVSVANGVPWSSGTVLTDDDSNDDWWGIVASGTADVRGIEVTQ